MLRSRLLVTDAEKQLFAQSYAKVSPIPVTLSYVQKVQVRAFFKGSRMVGGYAINARPPYRYFNILPPAARACLEAEAQVEISYVEATCLWFDRWDMARYERIYSYLRLMLDAFSRGQILLAGTFVPKLAKKQDLAMPYRLYEGPSDYTGETQTFWLHGGKRLDFALGLCRLIRLWLISKKTPVTFIDAPSSHVSYSAKPD